MYVRFFEFSFYSSVRGGEGAGVGWRGFGHVLEACKIFLGPCGVGGVVGLFIVSEGR